MLKYIVNIRLRMMFFVDNNSLPDSNNTENMTNLRKLNDELALRYLPVMIYMFVLLCTGFFGNTIVIMIYARKQFKSSTHYFIINLAVLDLLTVVIGMPTEIADVRYPYMFYAPAACKLLRAIESLSTMGSIITLMAVAIDRYNRICKYGKQMTPEKGRRICLIAVFVGVVTCWPAAVVFGKKTVEVNIPGANAVDCSTDDSMKGTKYPLVYYGSLFLYFITCVVFFTVVYTKIILFIKRHKKKGNIGDSKYIKRPTEQTKSSTTETSLSNVNSDENTAKKVIETSDYTHESTSPIRKTDKSIHKVRTSKTTIMLGIVTVVFVFSFLPFLVVMVIRNIVKHFEKLLSPSVEVFYKFCLKSYFINNSANPIIYSFLNANFRTEVKKLFRKCCVCLYCKRS